MLVAYSFVFSISRASVAVATRAMSSNLPNVATDVFSNWAKEGKDHRMESNHAPAVTEILSKAAPYIPDNYSIVDIGCGNGWVVRNQASKSTCSRADGVDGAIDMISKANQLTQDFEFRDKVQFVHTRLPSYVPTVKYNVAFSMEFLYYLSDSELTTFFSLLHSDWLTDNGLLAFGVDHYLENEDCHNWSTMINTPMLLWSEHKWNEVVRNAGFTVLHMWRAAKSESSQEGTLAIIARKTNAAEETSDENECKSSEKV